MTIVKNIKENHYFHLSDGTISTGHICGWPKQEKSEITKITYIFPDYDKQREFINQKNLITQENKINKIKKIAEAYRLEYLKEKKETEIASLAVSHDKDAKTKIDSLKSEIDLINKYNIFIMNDISPFIYNTQSKIDLHQQEVITEILKEIGNMTKIEFVNTPPQYDAYLKFGYYNDFYKISGIKYSSSYVRGFATFPNTEGTPTKEIKLGEQYNDSGTVFFNLSAHKHYKIINQNEINSYIEREGDISDIYYYKDDGTIHIEKNTDELINATKNNKHKPGTFEYHAILHEIGHALGLKHAWEYLENKDTTHVLATHKYSVMGYHHPNIEDADFDGLYPMTLQLLDILLLQYIYGKNTTTRLENNTYGFNSNTGVDAYSLTNIENKLISCIWDAGGIDTLDFSLYTVNQVINLNEGCFSDIGGLRSNISIAYHTVIENAIGGKGHDTLIGNHVNNDLRGGEGNDVIYGGQGDDYILGEMGNDQLSGGDGDDTLIDFYGDNILNGGKGNDRLFVSSGKNNLLGEDGDDQFYCGFGVHRITGGQGNDTFNFFCYDGIESNSSISDFEKNSDKIILLNRDYKEIDISKMKRVDKLSGDKNEISLTHDNQANKTIINISTSDNNYKSNIQIETLGVFNYDELFII